MSYYNERRKALLLIDKLLKANKSDAEIEFKVSRRFGFGKKLIEECKEQYRALQEE